MTLSTYRLSDSRLGWSGYVCGLREDGDSRARMLR